MGEAEKRKKRAAAKKRKLEEVEVDDDDDDFRPSTKPKIMDDDLGMVPYPPQ